MNFGSSLYLYKQIDLEDAVQIDKERELLPSLFVFYLGVHLRGNDL